MTHFGEMFYLHLQGDRTILADTKCFGLASSVADMWFIFQTRLIRHKKVSSGNLSATNQTADQLKSLQLYKSNSKPEVEGSTFIRQVRVPATTVSIFTRLPPEQYHACKPENVLQLRILY